MDPYAGKDAAEYGGAGDLERQAIADLADLLETEPPGFLIQAVSVCHRSAA